MKNSIFVLLAALNLYASTNILNEYKQKHYSDVCQLSNIQKYFDNPKILSLIGKSCLNIDKVYVLPYLLNGLRKDKIYRLNAIYFLTVIMEKRLLYSYLFDGFNIKDFNFPKTDYILSIVFEALRYNKFSKNNGIITIRYNNENIFFYKKENKMIIDEFKNYKLIKRHWYR